MSHNGMAWTRERSGPVGLVVQNPGDTVRPEFRTQKSSGPRLLRGEHESQDSSGLFAAGWPIEGHAPKVCFFLCKMGLRCMSVRASGFHFPRSLRSHFLPRCCSQLTAVDAAVSTAPDEYPHLSGSQESAAPGSGQSEFGKSLHLPVGH